MNWIGLPDTAPSPHRASTDSKAWIRDEKLKTKTNGQKTELFSTQCSFGDTIMQVSTLGSGGGGGGGLRGKTGRGGIPPA